MTVRPLLILSACAAALAVLAAALAPAILGISDWRVMLNAVTGAGGPQATAASVGQQLAVREGAGGKNAATRSTDAFEAPSVTVTRPPPLPGASIRSSMRRHSPFGIVPTTAVPLSVPDFSA